MPKEEGAEDLKEEAAAAKDEDAAKVVGKKGEKQQQKKTAAELSWPIKCSAEENCLLKIYTTLTQSRTVQMQHEHSPC